MTEIDPSTHCPRCGHAWDIRKGVYLYECCGLEVCIADCIENVAIGLRDRSLELVWDWRPWIGEKRCYLANGTNAPLPWLPWDITKERLKLLLVFL